MKNKNREGLPCAILFGHMSEDEVIAMCESEAKRLKKICESVKAETGLPIEIIAIMEGKRMFDSYGFN